MLGSKETMRSDDPPNYTYQDRVFENEMNNTIKITDGLFENMMYREALKAGFYDLQVTILNSLCLCCCITTEEDQYGRNIWWKKTMFVEVLLSLSSCQASRDRYRDITAAGDGMNWQLVRRFIEVGPTILALRESV